MNQNYNNHSDNDLINIFLKSGANEPIGEIYERYGHLVLGLCIKYLKNKDEAKDATLEIFSKLLVDLKKHEINSFKSWLYVYSKNFCLMRLRKRQSLLKKELELQDNYHLVVDYENEKHLEEKEKQIVMLEEAIKHLNKEQRSCVELFYIQNKSYQEIEKLTGYNNKEVKSHIQNGKRNLKLKLENKF